MGRQFVIGVTGCDHRGTDIVHGHDPLKRAVRDLENIGADIIIHGGDHTRKGLPRDSDGPSFYNSIRSGLKGGLIERIYPKPGNHERTAAAGFASLDYFRKWFDPLGEFPETSGVRNYLRPLKIQPGGRADLYRMQLGNVNLMQLGDVNRPETPLRSDATGDPGGVVLPETYERWKQEVNDAHDRDDLTFVFSHYGLKDTVTGTGEYEGGKLVNGVYQGIYHAAGKDNGQTSSYLAYVGEQKGRPFIEWMEQNPGKCHLWMNHHNHIYSGLKIGNKGHFAFKEGCHFVNGGFVSKFHGGPGVYANPKSRLIVLEDGSDEIRVRAYMHEAASAPGLMTYPKGFRPDKILKLPRPVRF